MTDARFNPYPEYKDSGIEWLRKIPEDWEAIPIKRVARIVNGATPRSSEQEYWNGDIAWATPDDLGQLGADTLQDTSRYITQKGYESCGTSLVPGGSLVLSTRAPIGHMAIAGRAMCMNQGCRGLVLSDAVQSRYCYYSLLAAKPVLQSRGQGSTFQELSRDSLGSVLVPNPSRDEQQAISDFLDRETAKIDVLVEKKERLIELLKEKRTALISHAVTKGLDPNVPMKDSGIEWLGKIPAHWKPGKIYGTCTVKARLGWKGLKAEEYVDDGFILLSTPNIKSQEIDFSNVNHITEARYVESPEIMLQEGDVLLAKDGSTLGIVNVIRTLPVPATVNSSIAVVRPNMSRFDSVYLAYFLSSRFTQSIIKRMKGGMGVPHLFQADIKKFNLLEPPIEDQRAIVDFLDRETAKIDALIAKVEEAIKLLKEYRTALIFATVTGKIDVRNALSESEQAET